MSGFEPTPRGDVTSEFSGAGCGFFLVGSLALVAGAGMFIDGSTSCETQPGTTATATTNVVYNTAQPESLPSPELSHRPERSACKPPHKDVKVDLGTMLFGGALIGVGVRIRYADKSRARGIPAQPNVTPASVPPFDPDELERFMTAAAEHKDLDREFGPPPPGPDD